MTSSCEPAKANQFTVLTSKAMPSGWYYTYNAPHRGKNENKNSRPGKTEGGCLLICKPGR